jgi:hypothetical protein
MAAQGFPEKSSARRLKLSSVLTQTSGVEVVTEFVEPPTFRTAMSLALRRYGVYQQSSPGRS